MSPEFWLGIAIGAIGWHAIGERLIAWLVIRAHQPHTG